MVTRIMGERISDARPTFDELQDVRAGRMPATIRYSGLAWILTGAIVAPLVALMSLALAERAYMSTFMPSCDAYPSERAACAEGR